MSRMTEAVKRCKRCNMDKPLGNFIGVWGQPTATCRGCRAEKASYNHLHPHGPKPRKRPRDPLVEAERAKRVLIYRRQREERGRIHAWLPLRDFEAHPLAPHEREQMAMPQGVLT